MINAVHFERNAKLLSTLQSENYKKVQSAEFVNKFPNIGISFYVNEKGECDNIAIGINGQAFIDGKERDAEAWLKNINPDMHTILVMGFGLGYHLEAGIKKYPDKRFICIEPDKRRLAHAMHLRDLEFVFKHCEIWLDETLDTMRGKIYDMITHPLSRGIEFIPYILLYEDFAVQLTEAIEKITSDFAVQVNTKRTLVDKWYTNRIKNAQCESVNFANFIGRFQGIPAILVGGGASLIEHIPLLKKLQEENRALIFAAGTTIEILLSHGVTPHFMGAIDQDPISEGGLHENLDVDVPMIFDGQVAYNSLYYKGRKIQMCLNVNRYTGAVIPNLPIVESAPSIGNVGLDILHKMGCSPIVMTGMDFSYGYGLLYCEGTRFQEKVDTNLQRMMIKNNFGEMVGTEPSFISMANWFEEYVPRVKPPVVNCTHKGIVFRNIPWKPITEIDFSRQFDLKKLIDDCWYMDGEPDYVNTKAVKAMNLLLADELKHIVSIVKKTGAMTPQTQSYKVWPLLDDYVNMPVFIAELDCERDIKKGKSVEEAVREFQKKRADIVIEQAEHLQELLA